MILFDVFKNIGLIFKQGDVVIDNDVCRMHYKVTVMLLIVCSVLLTSRQYFGDPINCIATRSSTTGEHKALESYCWIYSTFTVKKHFDGEVGRDVAAPGVGPSVPEDEVVHHKYYQWVCFMLLLQAGLFYFPYHLWGLVEGGRMQFITSELNCPLVNTIWTEERKVKMILYLTTWKQHSRYALQFSVWEIVNFLNVIGQIFLVDSFLGYQFVNYGRDIVESLSGYKDALSRVFPKQSKCTFHLYGPSGSLQNIEALCVLPLNVVNEKIFALLWVWLAGMTLLSFCGLLFRIVIVTRRDLRKWILFGKGSGLTWNEVELLVDRLNYSEWFFLNQISKNVNPLIFQDLFDELVLKYGRREGDDVECVGQTRPRDAMNWREENKSVVGDGI